MSFISKIKNAFRPHITTIALYDVSDVILLDLEKIEDVKYKAQCEAKVDEYYSSINIGNLESLIEYNTDICSYGVKLTDLLINYLISLNEIIRKDNKTKEELEKLNVDLTIKNIKVLVIKEMLQNLWLNSELRAIALERYKNEFEHKNPRFIEIFSRAGRIKRNTDLRSLNDALDRCKLTIKVLGQQISAVEGRIKSNNVLLDEIAICNHLVSDINNHVARRKIYEEKLAWFKRISEVLDLNFSKLDELESLLKGDYSSRRERIIINLIAITEVELDKYILINKEKLAGQCMNEIYSVEFGSLFNETIRKEKRELLDKCKKLYIKSKLLGDAIKEEYKDMLYKAMFRISICDINHEEEFKLFLDLLDSCEDVTSYYIEQVVERISKINKCESNVVSFYRGIGKFKELRKLLDNYFKGKNGKYDYEYILRDKDLFPFLIAFDGFSLFEPFFKDSVISSKSIDLKSSNRLVWSEYIPRETLYYLYELNGKEEPAFYDIYKLLYEKTNLSLPEGIVELRLNSGVKFLSDHPSEQIRYLFADSLLDGVTFDSNPYYERGYSNPKVILPLIVEEMRKRANGGGVFFPDSLRIIVGDIFCNVKIHDVLLNDGLEYIGVDVFRDWTTDIINRKPSIMIPPSVSRIDVNAFDLNRVTLKFSDYMDSKLLYNLLYSDDIKVLKVLKELLTNNNIRSVHLRKMVEYENQILSIASINSDDFYFLRDYGEYAFSEKEALKVIQHELSEIIKEKTGVNIKEYQDGKMKTMGGLSGNNI